MAQISVTFQPGGFASGQNYTSWSAMWTAILPAISASGGGAEVTIDAQFSGDVATVAAGSWNLEKVLLVGRRAPNGNAPTLVFPDGANIPATCTRLRANDVTLRTTRTTSPLWAPSAASPLVQGDQLRLSAAGAQPLVAPVGAGLFVVLGPGSSTNNDGAAPIAMPAGVAHVARLFLNADAEVRADSVVGPADASVVAELAPNAILSGQPNFLGAVSTTGPQQAGPTAARPANPYPGRLYYDTDLERQVVWDEATTTWVALARDADAQAAQAAADAAQVDASQALLDVAAAQATADSAQATADAVQLALSSLDTDDVANTSGVPGTTATDALDDLQGQVLDRATLDQLADEASARIAADALLAPLASPSLTGNPTVPTASPGDADTTAASTAFVAAAVLVEANARGAADALLAPKASPALTGTPTAPTASTGTNTTQVATTAFVQAQIAASPPATPTLAQVVTQGSTTGAPITVSSPGADTVALETRTTSGANGSSVQLFVGTRNPEGNVTGSPGDAYFRDNGASGGAVYLKATGVASTTGWRRLTPMIDDVVVTSSGTVALTASETSIQSTSITLPVDAVGIVESWWWGNSQLGAFLLGTNGAQARIRIGGAGGTFGTEALTQFAATLAVTISQDSSPMSCYHRRTGLSGTVAVDLMGVKTGGVSSASIVGSRTLKVRAW